MRKIARYTFTAAFVVFIFVAETISRQNIESWSETNGYSKLFDEWWFTLENSGYDTILFFAILLFAGFIVGIWLDSFLKVLPSNVSIQRIKNHFWPSVTISPIPNIGWTRRGDSQTELTSFVFAVQNNLKLNIINPKIECLALLGQEEFKVFLADAKGRYAIETVKYVPAGTDFNIQIDLQGENNWEEEAALETFAQLSDKLNNQERGLNGIYVEPFISKFGGIEVKCLLNKKTYKRIVSAATITANINEVILKNAKERQSKGIVAKISK